MVNGLPFRHSASYTSPAGPYESYTDTLGGHLVMEFGPGNHSVGLQWKKSAGGVVSSWSNRPSSHDGFAGGRSIVVTAQVRRKIVRLGVGSASLDRSSVGSRDLLVTMISLYQSVTSSEAGNSFVQLSCRLHASPFNTVRIQANVRSRPCANLLSYLLSPFTERVRPEMLGYARHGI